MCSVVVVFVSAQTTVSVINQCVVAYNVVRRCENLALFVALLVCMTHGLWLHVYLLMFIICQCDTAAVINLDSSIVSYKRYIYNEATCFMLS